MNFLSSVGIDWPHLCPVNTWTIDENGEKYSDGSPKYVIDETTQEKYLNQKNLPRKFLFIELLFVGSLTIVQIIPLVSSVVFRILKIVTFYHFRKSSDLENDHLKSRFYSLSKDIFRILISPLGIPFFFITAAYRLINIKDGTKLHARMEKIFYGHALIVLCFHPQPKEPPEDLKLKNFQAILTNTFVTDALSVLFHTIARIFLFFYF